MSSYQYRKSHCGDKTVVRSSYLRNGISYTGKITSLYWIRSQLFECGFGEAWYNQGISDTEILINVSRQRVYDIYKQSWRSRLRNSSLTTFYRAIKDMHLKNNYMRIEINVLVYECYPCCMVLLRKPLSAIFYHILYISIHHCNFLSYNLYLKAATYVML